jgi:hypothetical protein
MVAKDKIQRPVRFYPSRWQRIKEKIAKDDMSFQKLCDVMLDAYMKNNKEIRRLVEQHKKRNKIEKKNGFTDDEADYIFSQIESVSPLNDMDQAMLELEEEL